MEIIRTKPREENFHLWEDVSTSIFPAGSPGYGQKESIPLHLLHTCLVLVKDKKPLARLALYNNPALYYNTRQAACVGNYACTDNHQAAQAILHAAREDAQKLGSSFLIGPMNGSTWNNYRFSLQNDHPNFLLEPWNPLYYNQQFEEAGYKSIARYSSSLDRSIVCDRPEVIHQDAALARAGVRIRSIRMNVYESELKKLYPFLLKAFQSNFLYTPIAWESFLAKYREAAPLINPDYVLMAEDAQDKLIGFIFCYDDKLNTREKSLVVKTIARDNSSAWKGLGQVIANRVIRLIKERGYKSIVHAFMIEGATSTEASRAFNGTTYKQYALYGMDI
ncbi:MAG: hypothetical protein ACHQRM_09870 [Bacteroidia bacterium]